MIKSDNKISQCDILDTARQNNDGEKCRSQDFVKEESKISRANNTMDTLKMNQEDEQERNTKITTKIYVFQRIYRKISQ